MIKKYVRYFLCFFPCVVLAAVTPTLNLAPTSTPTPVFSLSAPSTNFEISIAGGFLHGHTHSTHLVVSPYETDSVIVGQVAGSTLWKFGIGYSLFAEQLKNRAFLTNLLMELNFYRSTQGAASGVVWQYQLPQFENYSFRAPIKSTRLMLEIKPSLFFWHGLSPYPILGVGVTRNTISFNEKVISANADPNNNLILGSHSSMHFAYDLGMGVRVDMGTHVAASLEYLYTNLGHVTSSAVSANGAPVMSPPRFGLSTRAVLLGFSWKI